jgi:membrane associated rhomboid family serine protease
MVCWATKVLIIVMSILYIIHTVWLLYYHPPPAVADRLSLIPRNLTSGEFTRVLTSPLIHMSPIAFFFNMYDLYDLGSAFEKTWGSSRFLLNVFGIATLSELIVWSLSFLLDQLGFSAAYDTPFWGFGAVIMTFVVFDRWVCETRKLFRLFTIPARFYPWVLLLIRGLLTWNMTFLADLAGILVGYVFDPHTLSLLGFRTTQEGPVVEPGSDANAEASKRRSRSASPAPIAWRSRSKS